jgi:saccharopine dehydrogenase-like NADP-dependent oxidoreductase
LTGNIKNATAKSLDVSSAKDLDSAVSTHDLVISLIPYTFHVAVIKSAIKYKRNVVTTSYVSDAIQALEPEFLVFQR